MISLKQLLQESYVNLQTPKEKLSYVDIMTDLIYKSYAPVGGFKSIEDIQELRDEIRHQAEKRGTFWKLSRRNGAITAAVIYKKTSSGTRTVASATNGTKQGKSDLYKIKAADIKHKRAFSEVSDAMEHIMLKYGAKKYPFEVASKVLKNVMGDVELIPDEDGYHYFRVINGKLKRKLMVGYLKNFS